jgi:hypothetical protein
MRTRSTSASYVLIVSFLPLSSKAEPTLSLATGVKSYQTRAEYADPLSGTAFVCLRIIMDYTSSYGEMLVNPVKGIQHNVAAIPLGMANIVGSISEGTRNLPKSYGSTVRRTGEITGWKSGLRAAGKGLFFGVQDGLTGLVTEPMRGAAEEVSSTSSFDFDPCTDSSFQNSQGSLGALKGVGRGVGNLILKPAAGGRFPAAPIPFYSH